MGLKRINELISASNVSTGFLLAVNWLRVIDSDKRVTRLDEVRSNIER